MQQLVAQAKGDVVGWASAQQVGMNSDLPNNTPNPFPTLPLGGGIGLAFLGRLRSSRFGGMSIAPDYATLTTQYAVSANAAFTNLNTPAGWNTQGGVDIASGTAKLNEVSTRQTRLSQVFMVGERDRYLSFTLSGTAIDDLNGAPDDIGQLQGGFSGNMGIANNAAPGAITPGWNIPFPSQSHAWNVESLIKAALNTVNPMSKHITPPPLTEQLIENNIGWVTGTYFDPDFIYVSADGNMGDVIEVDLKKLAVDIIARELKTLPSAAELAESAMTADQLNALTAARNKLMLPDGMKNFILDSNDAKASAKDDATLKLITVSGGDGITPYSRSGIHSLADGEFIDTGRMYFAPNITPEDEKTLRNGGVIATPKSTSLNYRFEYKDADGKWKLCKGSVFVTARDYASAVFTVFFGDRPLDNPGYSKFTLQGNVGVDQTNDVLDVYRVEQRLKYLGYPAMGYERSPTNNTLQDFDVNGEFKEEEQAALKLFEKVVRYGGADSVGQVTTTLDRITVANRYHIDIAFTVVVRNGAAAPIVWNTEKITLNENLTGADKLAAQAEAAAVLAAKKESVQGKVDDKSSATYQKALDQYNIEVANSQRFDAASIGADGVLGVNEATSLNWLNAYNAPHWMQFFESVANSNGPTFKASNDQLKGWTSQQLGQNAPADYRLTAVEVYGTSWMFDLMAAKNSAAQGLHTSKNALFNGSVDANLGITPKGVVPNGLHNSHDLGMAFDMGFRNFIPPGTGSGSAQNVNEALKVAVQSLSPVSWSIANAVLYSQPPASQLAADQLLALSSLPENDQVSAIRNLLSLFAVVRSDPTATSGTWNTLNIVSDKSVAEENQIRAALFGDGSQNGALISDVLFGKSGANQYANMKAVLEKLTGITAGNDDKNHFHIYLRPPEILPIRVASNLLADAPLDSQPGSVTLLSILQAEAQGLLDYAQTVIETGEEIMFTMEIPYVPVLDTPIVLAQAATPSSGGASAGSTQTPSYILNGCQEMPSEGDPTSAERFIDPAGFLAGYYYEHFKHEYDPTSASVQLLEGPKHGKISARTDTGHPMYQYDAEPGYVGKDQVIFMATYHGKTYKVVVNLRVAAVESIPDNAPSLCPPPQLIKVNPKPASGSLNSISVTLTLTDLPTGAIGQTTGTNITLDTNAAGNNWFIDTTPWDNSEYLPTSNPNEWVAKVGSAAEGKMDMLSVLLHEYGHALGIEHSADSGDYMATTLTPGVRRMPSADELALMQQLVAQAKGEMTSWFDGLTTNGQNDAPTPFPTLPLSGLGLSFLGFLRSSRFGGVSIMPDYATLTTQYAVSASGGAGYMDVKPYRPKIFNARLHNPRIAGIQRCLQTELTSEYFSQPNCSEVFSVTRVEI